MPPESRFQVLKSIILQMIAVTKPVSSIAKLENLQNKRFGGTSDIMTLITLRYNSTPELDNNSALPYRVMSSITDYGWSHPIHHFQPKFLA